jgi:20S proteasome alpha/beta subunit
MLCTGSNEPNQVATLATSGANAAIEVLERELAAQMDKVNSIKQALSTVRSVAAEQAKEGRMVNLCRTMLRRILGQMRAKER